MPSLFITNYLPLTFYYLPSKLWKFGCQGSKFSYCLYHLFRPFPGVCAGLKVVLMRLISATWDQTVVDTAVWEHCDKTPLESPYLPWEVYLTQTVTFILSLSCGLCVLMPVHVPCWFCNFGLLMWLTAWSWACLATVDLPDYRLCLIQVPVSRHVIFAQMLWGCILWWWGHCSCLTHWDPWLPVGLPLTRNLS